MCVYRNRLCVCVCVCVCMCIDTCVCVRAHGCVHSTWQSRSCGAAIRIRTYMHTYMHPCIRAYIHAYTHAYTCIHTCIHTVTDTATSVHAYTHIHAYMHTYIHTVLTMFQSESDDLSVFSIVIGATSYVHTHTHSGQRSPSFRPCSKCFKVSLISVCSIVIGKALAPTAHGINHTWMALHCPHLLSFLRQQIVPFRYDVCV